MLRHYENRSARYIVPRGTFHAGYVGTRKKPSTESGAAGTDYSDGCRRYAEPRDRSPFGYQQANGTALATTLFGFSTGGVAKGCSPSRSYPQNQPQKNSGRGRSHSAYHPARCNSLEHPKHGKGPRAERSNDPANMETAQPQTSFGQNLQAQSRQTLRREALRRGWPLSQPSRQVAGLVCGREEPNPGFGSNPARFADEKRPLCNHDARLQTQWNDYFICSPQHARRQGHWRLHATSSASGVYPFSQEDRRRDSCWVGSALDCGQLRHAQTSPRKVLAQTAPTVPFTLYPNLLFLAEPGGALVPRAYRQAYSSRQLPERDSTDYSYQRLYRQSQSKSTGLRMDCTCRTNFNQSRQK